jgi:beta-N-acetylhexosaminidase
VRSERAINVLTAILLLLGLIANPVSAATEAADSQAKTLMAEMSPAEKVGQLFLVTFDGVNISPESKIADLITNGHIGGVVLSADKDNFVGQDTTGAAYDLISGLQNLAWQKAQTDAATAGESETPAYIPLYVGISQQTTNGQEILNGLSDLPNEMTLGATWSSTLAQKTGTILGEELAALGFNLYLGPALDVVSTRNLVSATYSGTNTFGGDPYWVGELGKAFVSGLHTGSNQRMSVVATHFPGLGEADRPFEDEVSTIQKSLEQLKQIELAPYLAVTGLAGDASEVDGLMVSHIRFQGFQGNIRATTRPVSFDQIALEQLLAVEPINTWRSAGGLLISDSLGSRAVRQFFDPTGQAFDPLTIARTAFLAGNDMLLLKDFLAKGDVDEYMTIWRVLNYFTQKYQEDPVFAQRVDASLERILQAKLALYGEFSLDSVVPAREGLANLGESSQISLNAAQEAITLISPAADYLNTVVTEPPSVYDYLTIFTDVRTEKQCSACAAISNLGVRSLQDSLMRLYGPNSTAQLANNRISSDSLEQLLEVLDNKTDPSDPNLVDNLNRSKWVIFNLQDLDPDVPASYALKRLLAERPDLLQGKKVLVFAYGAPYYLDSTEISKITAYYGVFSKSQPFLDVVARILMQELTPRGALPVSLSVVGYDLSKQTAPDPNQVIPLTLITPILPIPSPEPQTQTPTLGMETPAPLFRLGETVRIQAGALRDRNQHLVPDGTVVRFTIRKADENVIVAQPEATTQNGLALIEYRIDREGIFEVTASSEPATTSGILVLNTQGGSAELILPTPTLAPTPTVTPTAVPTPTPTPTPTPPPGGVESGYPRMGDWLLMLMILALGFGLAYAIGYYWWGGNLWGVRSGLLVVIGGLGAYIILTLGFPSVMDWLKQNGAWFVTQVAFVGMLFGWIGSLVWWMSTPGTQK